MRILPILSWAWLALLLGLTGRLALILWRELGRLHAVDAATLVDRASQLKPWPWKAPLSLVALALFALVLVATMATVWTVAVRYLRGRGMP